MKNPLDFTIETRFLLGGRGPSVIEYRRANHCLCWSVWITHNYIEFSACLDDTVMIREKANYLDIGENYWYHLSIDRSKELWSINLDGIAERTFYEYREFDVNLYEVGGTLGSNTDPFAMVQPKFFLPNGNLIDEFRITRGKSRYHCSAMPPSR